MPGNTIEVTAQVRAADKTIRIKKRDLNADEDDEGLAWFDFDAEDSVAQATGTLVWDASLAIVELLNAPDSWLLPALAGRRVLELGSGTGLAGLCCAAAGADMLLTDLASIANGILARNVAANVDKDASRTQGLSTGPSASKTATAAAAPGVSSAALQEGAGLPGSGAGGDSEPWPGAQPCGLGSVRVMPLDFCRPLQPQGVAAGCDPLCADVVLAIDIVWLKELIAPLAAAIAPILHHTSSPPSQSAAGSPAGEAAVMPSSSDVTSTAPSSSSTTASAPVPPSRSAQESGQSIQPAAAATQQRQSGEHAAVQGKVAFLAFGERATETSTRFLQLDEVTKAFERQHCLAEVRARHVVERPGAERMSVVVVQVTPLALAEQSQSAV